jgi:hypothetical protein
MCAVHYKEKERERERERERAENTYVGNFKNAGNGTFLSCGRVKDVTMSTDDAVREQDNVIKTNLQLLGEHNTGSITAQPPHLESWIPCVS